MWRVWYDLLAYTCRDPTWTFMNFGYRHSDPAIELLPLFPEDEPDRSVQRPGGRGGDFELQFAVQVVI